MIDLPQLQPFDDFNQILVSRVHPDPWENPQPQGKYNLVVIGGGTAGLVTAAGAAGLGAKVALIEKDLLGGDCLNVGCVPSKALIEAARHVHGIKRLGDFGLRFSGESKPDFAAIMRRMRRLRSEISPHDSAQRFKQLGVDVFLGRARFTARNKVDVGGRVIHFKKACIATGARAEAPSIPGLDKVEFLTNETLFSLTELPDRLGIIGAGPVGCEMAQSFARFGSNVCMVRSPRGILPREDRDAADVVKGSLESDGVRILCGGPDLRVEGDPSGGMNLVLSGDQSSERVCVDRLLVAVGRKPNVEELGLETAGVDFNAKGVIVNDRLQTTNPDIYAAGDVCSPLQFTHAADFMARIVIRNTLFHGRARFSSLIIPWSIYTDPELAQVGMNGREALQQGISVDTFTQPFQTVDRAVLSGATTGFVRVHVKKGCDKILGATVVGAGAGEMIGEWVMAMTHGVGLGRVANVIHPYPTMTEAVRKAGDQYNRTRLTPGVRKLMRAWLSFLRR